jgi:hypothetical protein
MTDEKNSVDGYIRTHDVSPRSCNVTVAGVVCDNGGSPLDDGSNLSHQSVWVKDGTELEEIIIEGTNTVVLRKGLGNRWHVVSSHPWALTQLLRFAFHSIRDKNAKEREHA